jgi:NAD dependent epimerase/dehydratase family enzyme
VSWVALTDLLGILERAVGDPTMRGLYHVASPRPVTNAQMMATLRRIHGRRFGLPSPAALTRIGAWTLGSDPALALTGRRTIPRRLTEGGTSFDLPDFEAAARHALTAAPGANRPGSDRRPTGGPTVSATH